MSKILRLFLLAAFAWLGYVLFSNARAQSLLENPDKAKVILLFGGTVLDGVGIATIIALWIVPAIGEGAGNYLFNPGTTIEADPHAGAIAKLAQGDPEGAIAKYEEFFAHDPSDTLALSEIARICCRDLGDTSRAANVIEQALELEWPLEQSSFLCNRLADIYLLQEDPLRARLVIAQVVASMEGTKFAANAHHRLNQIDAMVAAKG